MPWEFPADVIARFWAKVDKSGTCWLWTAGTNGRGYGTFNRPKYLRNLYPHPIIVPHRFAWELAHRELIGDREARHRCDVGLCCNPGHIEPGSHAENMGDCVSRGRIARGTRNGQAKLTDDTVRIIKARIASGERPLHVARAMGIEPTNVYLIRSGKRWSHI